MSTIKNTVPFSKLLKQLTPLQGILYYCLLTVTVTE
jgi:hypothetical protein